MEYTIRSIALDAMTPVAYGMLKLLKVKGNPPPCRRAVAVEGVNFHCIRRWIDMHLRDSLDQMPSYVKNSNYIALALRCLIAH